MKNVIFFILLMVFADNASAQNWIEPVNVSNMNDFILSSDFTIDHNGIIHCVWNLKYENNYGVIYYASSEDGGITWTNPLSISQNEDLYCTGPQIVNDSDNKLYVGYDLYDFSPVTWGVYATIVINEGSGWGEPLQLAEGMKTRLAVDNNNRVYVFWYQGAPHNGEFCYQYLEGGFWSEIFIPFDNSNELTGIWEIVTDNDNNLHCAGFYDPTAFSNIRPAYYKFDYNTQSWDTISIISQNTSVSNIDIALDTYQNPHICWGGYATYYNYFNGQNWSLADTVGQPDTQHIEIDVDEAGKVHIAAVEGFNNVGNLVYYHRPDGLYWDSTIVAQAGNTIFTPEFEIHNNSLYLVYKSSDQPGYGDVYLTRHDDLVSTKGNYFSDITSAMQIQNKPNPFKHYTSIDFSIKKSCYVKLEIRNSMGHHVVTLIDDYLTYDNYSIKWVGVNNNGKKVPPGLYLYCLHANESHIVKKILYCP